MDAFLNSRKVLYVRHNNSLKLLRVLMGLSGNRHLKILTYFLVIFHSAVLIWQLYLLSQAWERSFVIQYSPSILISVVGICAILFPLMFEKKLQFFNDVTENSFYSLDMVGEGDTEQRIIRKSKQTEYLFCVNVCLILITGIFFFMNKEDTRELFMFVAYFEKRFSSQADLIIPIFYVLYLLLCLYFINVIGTLVYFTAQLLFQFYILNDCIPYMLGRRYKFCKELELPFNEVYQKKVFQRLTFCIQYHEMLLRNGKIMISAANKFVGLYLSVFYVLWISTLANIFLSPIINYPRVFIQVTTLAYTGVMVAEIGDEITTESTKVQYAFKKLPWYMWKLSNKKILLHVLIHAARGLRLGPLKMFTLDRTLLTQIIKFIWYVSTVMLKIRDV